MMESLGFDIQEEVESSFSPLINHSQSSYVGSSDRWRYGFSKIVYGWFKRRKSYINYLKELSEIPPLLKHLGHTKVKAYKVTKTGERVPFEVEFSAYDVLEFLVTYSIVSSKELRKELVDSIVEQMKHRRFQVQDGSIKTINDILKESGVSWDEFEKVFRMKLEASMEKYRDFILGKEEFEGSYLAKHIIYRNRVEKSGRISEAWFTLATRQVSLGIMTVYVVSGLAKLHKIKEVYNELIRKNKSTEPWGIRYFRYVSRYSTVVEDVIDEELHAIAHETPWDIPLLKKISYKIKRKSFVHELTPDKAREDFEKMVREARSVLEDVSGLVLPPEIIEIYSKAPVGIEDVEKLIEDSKLLNENKERVDLTLD